MSEIDPHDFASKRWDFVMARLQFGSFVLAGIGVLGHMQDVEFAKYLFAAGCFVFGMSACLGIVVAGNRTSHFGQGREDRDDA